jgi:GH15 family glucan-1,4-alpha-glucosidase
VIEDAGRTPLGARSWIGDGYHGATVGPDGTIDWLATGGLNAPADFYALLDPAGGAIRIGPAGARRARNPQRLLTAGDDAAERAGSTYRPGTVISELDLRGPSGLLRVTDLWPWPGPNERPVGRVVRVVTALAGPIDVEVEIRPGRGLSPARQVSTFADGLVWDGLMVRTGFPLDAVAGNAAGGATAGGITTRGEAAPTWRGVRRLEPGDSFVVTIDRLDDEHHGPLSLDAARAQVAVSAEAWRSWVAPLRVGGPYRDVVERAALTLRTLSGAGAPLAAGTMSLPRRSGSERTEDERVVRWRDAAGAAATLARVGLAEDAEAAEAWLRRAVTDAELPWPASSLADGAPVPEEGSLEGLSGWRGSQPVRIGGPDARRDLDVYGDVAAAVSASTSGDIDTADADPWRAAAPGPLSAARSQLSEAADWVGDHWHEPDHGVWSLGGPPLLLVASRVQAWYALQHTASLIRAGNPLDLTAAGWQLSAGEIVKWLETDALAADGGLRLSPSPHDYADAALLRVAWRSPWPPDHAIVVRTVDRTLERLSNGPLLLRHSPEIDDGRAGPDSPDLLASLWAVRALAALGRWEEAHERMEWVCALPGPSGIFSTAADPLSGELLGNLPATGVHLAVIDAALALERGPR